MKVLKTAAKYVVDDDDDDDDDDVHQYHHHYYSHQSSPSPSISPSSSLQKEVCCEEEFTGSAQAGVDEHFSRREDRVLRVGGEEYGQDRAGIDDGDDVYR